MIYIADCHHVLKLHNNGGVVGWFGFFCVLVLLLLLAA